MKHASLLASLFVTACFTPNTNELPDAVNMMGSTTDVEPEDASNDSAAPNGSEATGSDASTTGADAMTGASGADPETSGADDVGSDSTGDADDPSDPTDVSCPAGFVCGLDVPSGWDGPFVRVEGGAAEACENVGSALDRTLFEGLIAPPASCSCACSDVQGADCSPANVRRYSGFDCDDAPFDEFDLEVGQCQAYANAGGAGFTRPFRFAPSVLIPGACNPSESEAVDPLTWESTIQLCGVVESDCGQEGCWPEPESDAQLCIAHDGEHGCPAGFEVQSVLHAGAEDQRSCSSCSCGEPTGLSCSGLELVDAILPEHVGPVTMNGNCVLESASGELCFEPDLDGACAPSGGDAVGEATPSGPTTVCCAG